MSGEAVQSSAADSKELQNLVQSATASLGEKLDCEQRDILTELYKMRELLGAPRDEDFQKAFKSSFEQAEIKLDDIRMEVHEVRKDIADMRNSVEEQLNEIKKTLLSAQSDRRPGTRARNDDESFAGSVRNIDKASVSGTFKYIRQITGTGKGGQVPVDQFLHAFEALFLDGHELSKEQADELQKQIDASGDGGVAEVEYVRFFRVWLVSGTDRVREWLSTSSPTVASLSSPTPASSKAYSHRQSSLPDAKPERWTSHDVANFVRDMGDAYESYVIAPL